MCIYIHAVLALHLSELILHFIITFTCTCILLIYFLLKCFCPVNRLAFQSNLFQTLIPTILQCSQVRATGHQNNNLKVISI